MAIQVLRTPASYSVLIHAGIFALLLLSLNSQMSPVFPRPPLWLEIEETASRKADVKSPLNSEKVVQTQRPLVDTPPRVAPDAFLGERTQTVDRQTVNRDRRTQTGHRARSHKPLSQGHSPAPPALAHRAPREGLSSSLRNFGLPLLAPQMTSPAADPSQDFDQNQSSMAREEDSTSLASQAPKEYLKGFKESDQTLLNTKESVFFPYIQRIRDKLDVVWERTLQDRMKHFFNRGGQLPTDQDHNTQLLVTLNHAGEVTRVQVVEGSGVRDLDSTAVDAFRMAGPFPNPPKGLLNAEGTVKIRWDMVVFS
ncbi:MAG: energy transducer TonB [Methylotenera sp.]|nr:energy transducer TonB [Oligoflexia bacterium]